MFKRIKSICLALLIVLCSYQPVHADTVKYNYIKAGQEESISVDTGENNVLYLSVAATNANSALCTVKDADNNTLNQMLLSLQAGSADNASAYVSVVEYTVPKNATLKFCISFNADTLFRMSAIADINNAGISTESEGDDAFDTTIKNPRLNAKSISMLDHYTYDLTILNYDGKSVSWLSSDENVATVSSSGTVTGISEGTCVIYAIPESGESMYCNVTIRSNKFRVRKLKVKELFDDEIKGQIYSMTYTAKGNLMVKGVFLNNSRKTIKSTKATITCYDGNNNKLFSKKINLNNVIKTGKSKTFNAIISKKDLATESVELSKCTFKVKGSYTYSK